MAHKRKVANLLGLAVLSTLFERPMHRYEIATVLRERGKDRDMSIKWGSLYTVVDNLTKHGLLEITGTDRDGARPERTIYHITPAGREELADWTRDLLRTPQSGAQPFVAGLSVAAVLAPDDVVALLDERIVTLCATIDSDAATLTEAATHVPRLFLIEDEYMLAMLRAELDWVSSLRDELVASSFPGIDRWRRMHRDGFNPQEVPESH
ncbi:PadR family transcriptional regulator [Gordonia sp. TBRC 11910]|uniref:PadR family transcriptional regulator n=1 Tax=Gordonia asplenii TaxID=2725283 RepID=A0A848KR92_9ACTN|nr:PadR family transcriptional regulator [Gordonia asplenii]NMO00910.1 PadR family transcriptional regulator [Gordonia asplenii]